MKLMLLMCAALLLSCGSAASAQTNKPVERRSAVQVLEIWVANTEAHLVPLADAMPEEKYSFAPTGGEFKGVRTFAEQVKHLAANNYKVAAYMLLEKPTADQADETGPETVKTKAEIMKYLKGSFAALHKAVAAADDKNIVEPLEDASRARTALALETRLGLAIDAMAHSFNHYGQLVEYLRMNGIVPPDSR
jgi:uncharacterized damage-inducible protein DinB